jgi:hypothetical protein
MPETLNKETVSQSLMDILRKLMTCEVLSSFRLVGGTSLSLQLGHRRSIDIDMFSDEPYGSINFPSVLTWLKNNFNYVSETDPENTGFGISCFLGSSEADCIKLDLYYTDKFIRPAVIIDDLRIASIEDIAAMKLELISKGGRKKDFWDISELAEHFTLAQLLSFFIEKYPFFDMQDVIAGLIDFNLADENEDPVCLKGKAWELIKIDLEELVKMYKSGLFQSPFGDKPFS